MVNEIKTDQNTLLENIDIFKDTNTESLIFRYFLANSYCKDKIVADVSCGCGYGTVMLKALGAKEVYGFDIDKKAIEQANIRNPRDIYKIFNEQDITKSFNKQYNNFFDTTVSIETFEHLQPELVPNYLKNLYNITKDKGTIFITTPRLASLEFKYNGGTHLKEYKFVEFANLITTNIPGTYEVYGLQEIRIGQFGQLVSILTSNVENCKIMCCVIKINKEEK